MQTSTEPGEAALPAAQPCALATPKVAALARQLLGYEACSPPFPAGVSQMLHLSGCVMEQPGPCS